MPTLKPRPCGAFCATRATRPKSCSQLLAASAHTTITGTQSLGHWETGR
jgi:hypothetical protein